MKVKCEIDSLKRKVEDAKIKLLTEMKVTCFFAFNFNATILNSAEIKLLVKMRFVSHFSPKIYV